MTTDRNGDQLEVGDVVEIVGVYLRGMRGVIRAISGDMLDVEILSGDSAGMHIHLESVYVLRRAQP